MMNEVLNCTTGSYFYWTRQKETLCFSDQINEAFPLGLQLEKMADHIILVLFKGRCDTLTLK